MTIRQFYVEGLAHLSYLVAGEKECVVIDPERHPRVYLEAAAALGRPITGIVETHLHADFVSGHLDLAEITGAKIYAPAAGRCRFPHEPVAGGDGFRLGGLAFTFLDTPGHTPEHVSCVLADHSRGDEPAAVFCGDTLFVGDVGRPDLFPGRAEELAAALFDSLHEKLLALPDSCLIYPAHGAGSLCGRSIGAMRLSTVGYERRCNPALRIRDRAEFARSLTTGMPPAPDHFSRCSEINGSGPELLSGMNPPRALEPGDFAAAAGREALVVDTRDYGCFSGAHLPGSLFIGLGGNFATFAGWLLPPDRDVLLVADGEQAVTESVAWLRRVGIDRVAGFLDGGAAGWARSGRPVSRLRQLGADGLQRLMEANEPLQLIDVRSPGEFDAYHVDGAANIPVPDLRVELVRLDPEMETVLICSTGNRSTTAASILARNGFRRLSSVSGGVSGYSSAGYGGRCAVCAAPHGPRLVR